MAVAVAVGEVTAAAVCRGEVLPTAQLTEAIPLPPPYFVSVFSAIHFNHHRDHLIQHTTAINDIVKDGKITVTRIV